MQFDTELLTFRLKSPSPIWCAILHLNGGIEAKPSGLTCLQPWWRRQEFLRYVDKHETTRRHTPQAHSLEPRRDENGEAAAVCVALLTTTFMVYRGIRSDVRCKKCQFCAVSSVAATTVFIPRSFDSAPTWSTSRSQLYLSIHRTPEHSERFAILSVHWRVLLHFCCCLV